MPRLAGKLRSIRGPVASILICELHAGSIMRTVTEHAHDLSFLAPQLSLRSVSFPYGQNH